MHILPSYLRRKGGVASGKNPKKAKTVKTWDRDVFCIPESVRNKSAGGNIRYPRGKYRAELARCGLIGKLHMTSEMTAEEVSAEVRSVFKEPMGNNPDFPFLYLQPTGGGSKSPFPLRVHHLRGQHNRWHGLVGTVYILAQSTLNIPDYIEVTVT